MFLGVEAEADLNLPRRTGSAGARGTCELEPWRRGDRWILLRREVNRSHRETIQVHSMGSFFNSAYIGRPPWDIGRPQIEFKRMAEAREITGRVLDVGCGTGENALYIATLGHKVSGIDISPLAIRRAEVKARERGLDVQFEVWDAL